MKKSIYRIAFFVLLSTVFSAMTCYGPPDDVDHHSKAYFENRWDKKVILLWGIDRNDGDSYTSTYPIIEQPMRMREMNWIPDTILPDEVKGNIYVMGDGYYFEYLDMKDTIVVDVYDAELPDTMTTNFFLVRYLMSKEDLKKTFYHITYPPKRTMKDVKMLPLYEEVIKYANQDK